jgi:methylaspartate ammonia-lyase
LAFWTPKKEDWQVLAENGRLSARQQRLAAALAAGKDVRSAAKAARISERTAYRYLNDPAVRAALSQALDDALSMATRRVVAAMTEALTTLEAVHADTKQPASARVSAARAILAAGPRLREAVDLAERVQRLEEQLSEGR